MKATTKRLSTALAVAAVLAVAALPLTQAKAGTSPSAATIRPAVTHPAAERMPERSMHWFHQDSRSRTELSSRRERFGSTAIVGLESMRDLESLRERYELAHFRPVPALRAALVDVDHDGLERLLDGAATDGRIRYVSPLGAVRRTVGMPDDPLVQDTDHQTNAAFEWQFAASRVDRALDYTHGDARVVVGVIDTGAAAVPDLAGKIDALWTANPDGTLSRQPVVQGNDDNGHGTAVTSLIAANVDDGFGMAGFGGNAHVIAVHAGTQGVFYDASIAIAIAKLAALGARIVNISAGGGTPSEPILVDAIHKAAADGVLLIASAGNDHGKVSYPAAELQPSRGGRSYGLAVGASDARGRLAGFSNAGAHLSLVAPGVLGASCSGVLVALPPQSVFQDGYCYPVWDGPGGADYGYLAGTSFSAPQVAGIAALIWAVRPDLRNYEVADVLKQSASRAPGAGWTATMGCGILDAGAALELATSFIPSGPAAGSDATCTTDRDELPQWPSEHEQTIAFGGLSDKTLDDPDFEVSATASSGMIVSFRAVGACMVHVATVHLTRTGSCSITASQAGDSSYMPAVPVIRTFAVTRAIITSVVAVPAWGRAGTRVTLSFRVVRVSGAAHARLTVQRRRRTLARVIDGLPVASGRAYALAWRTPTNASTGPYSFCVTVTDDAHGSSARTCAPIRLR